MNSPKIIAYLKPTCGWSQGVRAVLAKYNLAYEDRDIINSMANREEMIRKSGQPLSPCVEIDGIMVADVSGALLEEWMIAHNIVQSNNTPVNVPLDQPCAHEMVTPTASVKVNF